MHYHSLLHRLSPLYGLPESQALLRLLCDHVALPWTDFLCDDWHAVSAETEQFVADVICRLEHYEPIQYILGTASFCGRDYIVTPAVLIPRPETEELVNIAISAIDQRAPYTTEQSPTSDTTHMTSSASPTTSWRVLDIGTGSGCIAITIAKACPMSHVTAWDISPEALAIARENGSRHNASNVTFRQVDMLDIPPERGAMYDVIISNPPYVCPDETDTMTRNTLLYEPHTALFVPQDDPLIFYRAIAQFAERALTPQGHLLVEVNPRYANAVAELLTALSFTAVAVVADTSRRPRFVTARR